MKQEKNKITSRLLKGIGIIIGAFLAGVGAYMATKTISVVEKSIGDKSPLSATVVQLHSNTSVVNPHHIIEGFIYMFDPPQYLQELLDKTPRVVITESYSEWGKTPDALEIEAWNKFLSDTKLHKAMANEGILDGGEIRLAIRNTSKNMIVIQAINAVVVKKYQQEKTWFMNDELFGCGGGEELPIRTVIINFHFDPPEVKYFVPKNKYGQSQESPVSIGLPPDDVLLLNILVWTTSETVDWILDLTYVGKNGDEHIRINDNGRPFRVYDPADRGFHILEEDQRIELFRPPC